MTPMVKDMTCEKILVSDEGPLQAELTAKAVHLRFEGASDTCFCGNDFTQVEGWWHLKRPGLAAECRQDSAAEGGAKPQAVLLSQVLGTLDSVPLWRCVLSMVVCALGVVWAMKIASFSSQLCSLAVSMKEMFHCLFGLLSCLSKCCLLSGGVCACLCLCFTMVLYYGYGDRYGIGQPKRTWMPVQGEAQFLLQSLLSWVTHVRVFSSLVS